MKQDYDDEERYWREINKLWPEVEGENFDDLERAAVGNACPRTKQKDSRALWANALKLEEDGGRRLWTMWYMWSHPRFGTPGGRP